MAMGGAGAAVSTCGRRVSGGRGLPAQQEPEATKVGGYGFTGLSTLPHKLLSMCKQPQ